MAIDSNVKTVAPGKSGFVTVTFVDGHTESMPEANAIANNYMEKIPTISNPGTKVTTTPKVTPGGYGNTALVSDPMGSGQTAGMNFTVPVNGQQVAIATLLGALNDPVKSAKIGAELRVAGWIPKGAKSATTVANAYTQLLVKAANSSMNPNDWLAQWKANGGGGDTAVSGPQTNINIRTYTPDTIRSVADQIYTTQLGRRVTDADLAKITAELNAKEKVSPTKTVSTPNVDGTVTTTATTGGVDEAGLITKQAQQMPEYGRMQNINFASWLDKAMTTGQPSIGSLTNGQ